MKDGVRRWPVNIASRAGRDGDGGEEAGIQGSGDSGDVLRSLIGL